MNKLPPQHLYKIISYFSKSYTFLAECFSKNIHDRLHKNPYYLNRLNGMDDPRFTFDEAK